jgi:glycosyltransferase involved in cell wall biosynthesis
MASGTMYDIEGVQVYSPYSSEVPGGKKLYNLHGLNVYTFENFTALPDVKAVISLGDYQISRPIGDMAHRYNKLWYSWFPVDYVEWEVSVAKDLLEYDCNLVVMSDWGEKLAKDNFLEPAAKIYHGVDTEIFKKSDKPKQETRADLNLQQSTYDKFIVGFVGQNMERKRLDKLIEGYAIFAKDKNNVLLLAHTDPFQNDEHNPSYPLTELVARNQLDAKYLHTHPANYAMKYSDALMAEMYNSMNVHVLPSSGEGFGVPVLEANACGTPSIMTNATTAEQLVGDGKGFLADVESTYMFRGFKRAMVSSASIAGWLQFCYDNPQSVLDAGLKASEDAKRYDFKIIQNQWIELLNKN